MILRLTHCQKDFPNNALGMVAGGYSVDRILTAYPDLSREDVSAALEYAAKVVDEEQVISR